MRGPLCGRMSEDPRRRWPMSTLGYGFFFLSFFPLSIIFQVLKLFFPHYYFFRVLDFSITFRVGAVLYLRRPGSLRVPRECVVQLAWFSVRLGLGDRVRASLLWPQACWG